MAFIATTIALLGLVSAHPTYELRTTKCARTINSTPCLVTEFNGIAAAVASCTEIVLQDIAAPANGSIDLRALLDHTTVTFSGTTTFGFVADHDYVPIKIGGNYITVIGAPGHVIEGNGAAYWDGQGSNGGGSK